MKNFDPACVTDYASLYRGAYFAHSATSSSFDQDRFPPALERLADLLETPALVDLGGGNGMLSGMWRSKGRAAVWLDYLDHAAENFRFFDLASFSDSESDDANAFIGEKIDARRLTTCLDVAEHIDVEHLAAFLLNLNLLTEKFLVLSISTRPSSRANRFHATILPIETWIMLLAACGFAVVDDDSFAALTPSHRFSGASEDLVAVSHWVRMNPFRDTNAHQHYFLLQKARDRPRPSLTEMQTLVARTTDTAYRTLKRELAQIEFPPMEYNLHFAQDWSFARSLLDVWPRDKAKIIIRGDCLAAPYRMMIENYLTRVGVEQVTISSANAVRFEPPADGVQPVTITATEGQVNILHQANSSVLLAARAAGRRTICLQHGMVGPRSSAHAAEFLGAWDHASCEALGSAVASKVQLIGSIKFLDALLPAELDAFEHRLGAWTRRFKTRCLVALGLHWEVMNAAGEATVLDWLRRTVNEHGDCLFLVRPHVDDPAIYECSDLVAAPNVLVVDELLLTALDWPLSRLLKHVDTVVTTFSTILIDAAAAGAASVLLPMPPSASAVLDQHLPISLPYPASAEPYAAPLSALEAGAPPLHEGPAISPQDIDAQWFAPSLAFFDNLARLLREPSDPLAGLSSAQQACADAVAQAFANLAFDKHPHAAMRRAEQALTEFENS